MVFAFLISDTATITVTSAISAVLGALLGSGGVYALLKVGPERTEINVKIASLLVKDLRDECTRLNGEIAQLKMQNIERDLEHETCQGHLRDLQLSVTRLQEDLKRLKETRLT